MPSLKEKAAYIKGLYDAGLKFPAWSRDRADYHLESLWNFCEWFIPRPLPMKDFHREWFDVAVSNQYFCILAPRDHCLVSGTQIATLDGLVPIENINIGTSLYGKNQDQICAERVVNVFDIGLRETTTVTLSNGKSITGTFNHKIYTSDGWKEIGSIHLGNSIGFSDNLKSISYSRVTQLDYSGIQKVYDLEVTGEHAYVANGIISHNSKSSSIGGSYPLWRIFMDTATTIMLVGSSSSTAELQLRVIKENIEHNDSLIEGFGLLKPDNPTKWTNSEIVVSRQPGIAHPTVVALGVGTAILSRRARLIIADDVVRDDEVVTTEQRFRLSNWIKGVLLGVLEAGDQIGFVGTTKSADDFYSELQQTPLYRFEKYDAIKREREDGSWETLWPEKWSEKSLRERMEILGTYQFNQNYRNITLADSDSPFPLSWLVRCQDSNLCMLYEHLWSDDYVKKIISVDLAMTTGEAKKSGDTSYFVAMVMGLTFDNHIHVLRIIRDRKNFPQQVQAISDLIDKFNPNAVVVESNAYQAAMTSTIAEKYKETEVVYHFTGRNKNDPSEGIPLLQPYIESGKIHLPYGNDTSKLISDVTCEELNKLGTIRRSDCAMALWFGVRYLNQFVRANNLLKARVAVL